MITKLTKHKECIIVDFIGIRRITLMVTEDIKAETKSILSQTGISIIINLNEIEFIDSNGIGCLISIIKTAKINGNEVTLCNVSHGVMNILELLHLPMILNIKKDMASSLENIQKQHC